MNNVTQQPRYLALDIGQKRIGIAVSDELKVTAHPVMTLVRRPHTREDLRSIARLARKYAVAGIVVGDPLHLSGEASSQTLRAREFARQLGELTGLPIHLHDERLTSREAHQILYEAGHPRQEHSRQVDQVAAVLILESFLQQQDSRMDSAGSSDKSV